MRSQFYAILKSFLKSNHPLVKSDLNKLCAVYMFGMMINNSMKRIIPIITLLALYFTSFGQQFPINNPRFPLIPAGEWKGFVAHNSEFYYSTLFMGEYRLHVYKNNRWNQIEASSSSIASTDINQMVAHNGSIYFATKKGLSVKTGTSWATYSKSNSNIPLDNVHRVHVTDDMIALLTSSGLSYKKTSATTWKNVSFADVQYTSSSVNGEVLIVGDLIYWAPFAKDIVKYNTKTEDYSYIVARLSGPQMMTVNGTTPYINGNEGLHEIGEFSTKSMDIERITKPVILFPVNFTDNKGKLWQIGERLSNVTLSTIQDGKYEPARFTIPIPLNDYDRVYFAYDETTDSVYCIRRNLAFSLDDVRNPKANYRKNLALLNINQVSAPITNDGTLLRDIDMKSAQYEVPKGKGKSAIYSSGLWIGGLDESDDLHLAAMTYKQLGNDFWPAPLNPTTGAYNVADSARFDRVWNVTKRDIQRHINEYNYSGSVSEDKTTEAIWNWPGNGSVGNASQLAPYVDRNNNGKYEPNLGDYPDVPGDQCIYWIMNDIASYHSESGGIPFGFEIHGMAYAYNCSELSETTPEGGINYTTFYRYKLINRSATNYKQVVIGNYYDPDLGDYADDYIGCHVTHNMGYVYNARDNDTGKLGYGLNPPMLSSVVLNAPIKKDDGVDGDGDGTVDENDEKRMVGSFMYYNNDFTNYGNPNKPMDYYNYMNARWKNGDCVTADGLNGRTGTNCTPYLYPGNSNPDLTTTWTEATASNFPSDRRFLLNMYPFDLDSKDSVTFEYALVYSRDSSKYEQLPKNLEYVKAIKDWYYDAGHPGCYKAVSVNDIDRPNAAKVYPNPTENSIQLTTNSKIQSIQILDVNGGQVSTVEVTYQYKSALVSMSELSSGIYFIQTITEDGLLTNKVIKK